jgi:hypothetical protein
MAALTGLTIIKRMTYRGNANEEWSNTYWLSGSVPADAAAWRTLFDALVAQEKTVFDVSSSVIAGYGYDSDADGATAVWSVDLTVAPNSPVPGTVARGSCFVMPGDVAVWERWGLDRLNSKGKRVYLRKYFHGALENNAAVDAVCPAQVTALNAFGAKMSDGSFAGSRVLVDRKHTGAAIINHGTSSWLTTRTLKRRGKRP